MTQLTLISGEEKSKTTCGVCHAVLMSLTSLNLHMRTHIAEPVCYLCKERCDDMALLKTHIRKVHKQEFYHMKREHATAGQVGLLLLFLMLLQIMENNGILPC